MDRTVDEIRVHVVVALFEELRDASSDARRAEVADKIRHRWGSLSMEERAAAAQILALRGLPLAGLI